jgi:hypothetical protein
MIARTRIRLLNLLVGTIAVAVSVADGHAEGPQDGEHKWTYPVRGPRYTYDQVRNAM